MIRPAIFLAPALAIALVGCADNRNRTASEQSRQEATEAGGQVADRASGDTGPAVPNEEPRTDTGTGMSRDRTGVSDNTRRSETRREAAQADRRAASGTNTQQERRSTADLPAGAVLRVRLDEPLNTEQNTEGDNFSATLVEPVVVSGRVVVPEGTRFQGTVTTAESSGRLAGKGVLTVKLDSFELNGRKYEIDSTTVTRITEGRAKRDIGIIGGGAAAGAAIGGITGGKKGALIGAGAGAAAGTGVAAATGKADVKLPAETVMVFTLQKPVDIRG